MRRAIGLIIGLALVSPGHAVIGDLNRDGTVDLSDFFIFADNFGLRGEPEPVGVDTVIVDRFVVETVRDTVYRDTLIRIMTETVRDTVEVERAVFVSVLDTVYVERVITVRDTVERIVVQTVRDTLIRIMTETVRDTVEVERAVFVSVLDTVYLGEDEPRLPVQESWSDVLDLIKPTLYWIGYTAKPEGNTRYDVTFVGTGFAVDRWLIVTNYHVASFISDKLPSLRSDLEPVAIAVRAGTLVYGEETYFLGTVTEDRVLLGFWDPRYDFTVSSPDIAMFLSSNASRPESSPSLEFARLATLTDVMSLEVGEEIGIYGFPGLLETTHSPFTLTPNPTFKAGTVSALRAYDETISLTARWNTGLMGKVVQHNLETAPGNSGSPIFNKRGEIVAIHNAGIPGGDAFDFGIRSDEIRLFLKSLYATFGSSHVNAKALGRGAPIMIPPYPPRVAP